MPRPPRAQRASPGKCQELEDQQVSLQKVSVLTLGVEGHGLGGVQDFSHLAAAVHDVGEAGLVDVGERAPGADRAGAGEGEKERGGGYIKDR